jgi:4a-hydroxytetrahydrobiopterin dehydratase
MHLSPNVRGGQRPPLALFNCQFQVRPPEMDRLPKKKYAPSEQEQPALTTSEIGALKADLPEWEIAKWDGIQCLQRVFQFDDFAQALDFTNRVGDLAEEQNHHPMLVIEWGQVTVTWGRVEFGGLHRNDFVMAGKTDHVYRRSSAIRKARQKQVPAQD